MGFFDFLMLVFLFGMFFVGTFFLWQNLPQETIDFESFQKNISLDLTENSSQFYPNMRYTEKEIKYMLSENCSPKKQKDFRSATTIIGDKTILSFKESNSPDLVISCSNIGPEPEEEGHFIAGEGGPATIINASKYSVILLGKIALYRPETCKTPQIATHEILHSLGFNHNNNSESIMYPFTDCKQTIDEEIISEINKLYSEPSLPDLIIESLTANKTGRYLNLEVTASNQGLKKIEASELDLLSNNKLIQNFSIGELDIGSKRHLTIQNLKIPKDTTRITVKLRSRSPEISKENNQVEIKLVEAP